MKKGQGKYCDNSEFMRAAYELYMNGFPANKIAQEMGREYPGLCRQTVQKIIRDFGWRNEKFDYLRYKNQQKDEKILYVNQLKSVAKNLYDIIDGKKGIEVNHQHFAQYLKCLDMISKFSGWETGKEERSVLALDRDMQNYLDVLEDDPVIGKNLEKRKRILQAEFLKKSRHE